MHPAGSILVFTTTSGAGFGMLAVIALLVMLGMFPNNPAIIITGFTLALGCISAGLIASTFHLGNPQRAWRALSQWRSSWLSREGVMAMISYPVTLAFAGALLQSAQPAVIYLLALLTLCCALVTIVTTANIYASLKTIPAWHHPLVNPAYLLLGISSGAVIILALLALAGGLDSRLPSAIAVLPLGSLLLKRAYWYSIDTRRTESTPQSATGLGMIGKVTPLEHPHSQANWVLREMGYRVARKHAKTLRILCDGCFAATSGCVIIAAESTVTAVLAVAFVAIATVCERWLFFAEARHVVTLYYYNDLAPAKKKSA